MVICNHILIKNYNKIIVVNNHIGDDDYEQCKSRIGIAYR